MKYLLLLLFVPVLSLNAQIKSTDFSLGSPFNEPDGRSEVVKINATDIVTLAKTKGNFTGSSKFALERYSSDELIKKWSTPLVAEDFEDYKRIYYNGESVVLLSVKHKEKEQTTALEAYGFDPASGEKLWTKELEKYQVEEWEDHPHKGKAKETFIDVICEHSDPDFITPFRYKHFLHFSPDESRFISYVYNYGEPKLTASVNVYDNKGNKLSSGKLPVDDGYINHGFYVDNEGLVYFFNSNPSGKLNAIRYNLDTKDFRLLSLPASSYQKDDFHIAFDKGRVLIGNAEEKNNMLGGLMYSVLDFDNEEVINSATHLFSDKFRNLITSKRKEAGIKGEENWLDYEITHFIPEKNGDALYVLEKRSLFATGYPHIGPDVFKKSHQEKIEGHVNAEGIILVMLNSEGELKWQNYIPKLQVFPAQDGLNTVSFILDDMKTKVRLIYACSENHSPPLHDIRYMEIDKPSGSISKDMKLANNEKMTLVKDYTVWNTDNVILIGKKGLTGRKSVMAKYKL